MIAKLIVIMSLVVFSCKARLTDTNNQSSDVHDVKLAFSFTNRLPWLERISPVERRTILSKLKLSVTADSKNSNCSKVVPEQIVELNDKDSQTLKTYKLTLNCTYSIKMKIFDENETYFETDPESVKQTIPGDGLINNYKICLKNAGKYFAENGLSSSKVKPKKCPEENLDSKVSDDATKGDSGVKPLDNIDVLIHIDVAMISK